MKRKKFLLLTGAIAALLLYACTPAQEPPPASEPEPMGGDHPLIIGVSMASSDTPYQAALIRYIRRTAEEMGVELLLEDAGWNVETQTAQLYEFQRRKVDAVILTPVNTKSMLVPLKNLRAAGIPLINLNMRVDAVSSEYIDTYVGASSAEEAVLAAGLFIREFEESGGEMAIIEGAVGSEPQIYRTQAFNEELTAYPQIQVMAISNGGWDRDMARLAATDLLTRYPGLQGIYCHDSEMALGALDALDALGGGRELMVVGISENEEYLRSVEEGRLYGLITQPPSYEGAVAVRCAVNAARGEVLRPWYKDPIQTVTSANVGQFLSGQE